MASRSSSSSSGAALSGAGFGSMSDVGAFYTAAAGHAGDEKITNKSGDYGGYSKRKNADSAGLSKKPSGD